MQLERHAEFVDKASRHYSDIDSKLVRAVITNEVITRGWLGLGETALSAGSEALGGLGTYGPAQLGPEARHGSDFDLSRIDALTYEGAIIGAARFLDKQRTKLISEGIESPTNGANSYKV